MKKLILFLFLPAIIFGQTENKQSLELPDFIITGTRGVEMPVLQKKKPKLIPVLSNDFFMPLFSPEDFAPEILPAPYQKELKLASPVTTYQGKAAVSLGRYTLPAGEFSFVKDFSGLIMNFNALGSNIGDYVPNAGYNNSLLSLGGDYFVKSSSSFFNGTKFSFNGSYFRNSYKMFASPVPADERNSSIFSEGASLSNNAFEYMSYDFALNAKQSAFNYLDSKETMVNGIGSIEFKSPLFNIVGRMDYKGAALKNNAGYDDYNALLGTTALLKIKPVSGMVASFGVYLANYNSSSFFMPAASLELILNQSLSLFADFSPQVELNSFSDILSVNRYASFQPAVFQRKKGDMKVSLRYEYGRYFEITGGMGFASYANFLYFEDNIFPGVFSPMQTDAKRFYSFFKFTFLPGPFGYFYSDLTFQQVKNDGGNYIPYQPMLDADLVYGYDFDSGLLFKVKLGLQTGAYTDSANNDKLPSFQDLSVSLGYKILSNLTLKLEANNITGSRNYYFNGYREKPFDILAGVEYRW